MVAPRSMFLTGRPTVSYARDAGSAVGQGATAGAIEQGDLMFLDSDDVKPASGQADALTEDLNKRTFALKFAGVSAGAALDNAIAGTIAVDPDWEGEMDCISATFEVGDLVAVDEAASGTILSDAVLEKTTDASLALGYCTASEASAVTRVRVRLQSRVLSAVSVSPLQGLFRGAGVNTETLAAGKTMVVGDAPVQVLDPGGAGRTILLPTEATSVGLNFVFINTADAAEVLTIEEDSGTTAIATPTQSETAIVWCDGTTWRGLVGANV